MYLQKLYLLWNIRDILDIPNGSGKIDAGNWFQKAFETSLSFTQLCNFLKMHNEYGSCLHEICENTVFMTKGPSKKFENTLHCCLMLCY